MIKKILGLFKTKCVPLDEINPRSIRLPLYRKIKFFSTRKKGWEEITLEAWNIESLDFREKLYTQLTENNLKFLRIYEMIDLRKKLKEKKS